jgi:hypothetical protein
MPHLPVIIDVIDGLEQLDQYHEQISDNITNEVYEGKMLEEAQTLLANAETALDGVKVTVDTHVGNLEAFLGI